MTKNNSYRAAVIGSGPAGLMAAQTLLSSGVDVDLFEAKPSIGRKLLMAGKSGLNLTKDEEFDLFLTRFKDQKTVLTPYLKKFGPSAVTEWANGLGIETFIGSSGLVFPKCMKASPLLRAWVKNLKAKGLVVHLNYEWFGWTSEGSLKFATSLGTKIFQADATILALGGASWPRLGSNGLWQNILSDKNILITPLRPANCGFDVRWSKYFLEKFAGTAVKSVRVRFDAQILNGDFIITKNGIEGGPIYSLSSSLRANIEKHGPTKITIDLAPDRPLSKLLISLSSYKSKRSWATHLKKTVNIDRVKIALLRECGPYPPFESMDGLSRAIKNLPITLLRTRPLSESISTAGGVKFKNLNAQLMIKSLPGIFMAGEMLDWDAPTGGYLLTACLALGQAAGVGSAEWLHSKSRNHRDKSRIMIK